MNALKLNSPVEALAFDYVSFKISDLVNNLLPLIAFVTAAMSFWRFRAAAAGIFPAEKLVDDTHFSPPPPRVEKEEAENLVSHPSPPSPPPYTAEDTVIATADVCISSIEEEVENLWSYSSPPPPHTAAITADVCDGVTRGRKFVMYYDNEAEIMAAEVEEEEEWSEVRRGCGGGRREEEWWEREMRMRTGEMGWYRYQDRTVINGNVVRLWEECRFRKCRLC